jgi:hypothetical protein
MQKYNIINSDNNNYHRMYFLLVHLNDFSCKSVEIINQNKKFGKNEFNLILSLLLCTPFWRTRLDDVISSGGQAMSDSLLRECRWSDTIKKQKKLFINPLNVNYLRSLFFFSLKQKLFKNGLCIENELSYSRIDAYVS